VRPWKKVVTAAVMATGLIVVAACGGSGGGGNEMTVVMWGGEDQKVHVRNAIEPWAKENNVKIKQDEPTDYAKFQTQVESGKVSWDVVEVEPNFANNACKKGWAEKLDPTKIDLKLVKAQLTSECAVPVLEYAFTIGYNTKTYSAQNHPRTWAEFFDTQKFPGKRGFWKYATGAIFEAALLADGVPADKLYPLAIERALAKLDTIKKDIVWYETGAQQQELVSSGETPLIQAWNGRIFRAAKAGQPAAQEWNQHILSYDQLVIPKGSEHAATAQEWIGWYLRSPQAQAGYSNETGYGPVSEAAMEYIKPEIAAELPGSTQNATKRAAIMDYGYWAVNYDAVTARLNEWAAK
jgi:putative spermidine/putrescine transport system substrate-binding protein